MQSDGKCRIISITEDLEALVEEINTHENWRVNLRENDYQLKK